MELSRYTILKQEHEEYHNIGIDALFDEQGVEHRRKMESLMGTKKEGIIYVSPSRASFIMDVGGIPQLQGYCHRSIFFSAVSARRTNPMNHATKHKLMMGSLSEELEHKIEKHSGKYVSSNELFSYQIDPQTMLIGEFDSSLKDKAGQTYIKEVKTCFGYMALRNHLYGTKKLAPYPRWSAVAQLMMYMGPLGIPYGVIKFIDGQNWKSTKSFILELKNIERGGRIVDKIAVIDGEEHPQVSMAAVMSRFMRLAEFLRHKTIPPKECLVEYGNDFAIRLNELDIIGKSKLEKHLSGEEKTGDWQCGQCEFRDLCQMDDNIVEQEVQAAIAQQDEIKFQASGDPDVVW